MIDAAFETEAQSVCDTRDAWFASLREFNAVAQPTGAMAEEIMRRDEEISARVEVLRRRYFPRAHELIISGGAAITCSRTARSIKRVWTATRSSSVTDSKQLWG